MPTAQPAEDMPAWLADVPQRAVDEIVSTDQGASKDHFDKMLENVGKANQPLQLRDTGVLDPSALPDWLNAVGDDGQPIAEASPDTLADAASAPDLASDSGWLTDMGLAAPEPSASPADEELA